MQKEVINTKKAPKAIGPYSQAVKVGNLIFVSGQIPLDPETGEIVHGDIYAQTERVLKNIAAILESAGSSMEDIVKATVYISDLSLFSRFNECYAGFFPENPPARATVEVNRLPRDVRIEIDVIAVVD